MMRVSSTGRDHSLLEVAVNPAHPTPTPPSLPATQLPWLSSSCSHGQPRCLCPKHSRAGAGAGAGLMYASSIIRGLAEDTEPRAVTHNKGFVVETEAQVAMGAREAVYVRMWLFRLGLKPDVISAGWQQGQPAMKWGSKNKLEPRECLLRSQPAP